MNHQIPPPMQAPKCFLRTRHGLGLMVLGSVAAFFLLTEHRAHLFGALPFLLFLACPLMHVFMHRGHGSHGHHSEAEPSRIGKDEASQSNQGDRS